MARAATVAILTAESGLTHYFEEIRRFPMLERQEEYMLAKRWREHGDREAAHKLVTSHLRLVAKIAMGYRGYGLPISEVISEGNVGLMQAVKRFEPEKGFRFATYADVVDQGRHPGVHPAFVVAGEDGHDRQPEEAVLQPAQGQEQDLGAGGGRYAARPGQDHCPAARRDRAGRGRHEPPSRRRRCRSMLRSGEEGDSGEWQDWLVDEISDQETRLAESEEFGQPPQGAGATRSPCSTTASGASSRRAAWPTIRSRSRSLADEFGVSRERVRQIEVRAFEKVQKAVKNRVAAIETWAALTVH